MNGRFQQRLEKLEGAAKGICVGCIQNNLICNHPWWEGSRRCGRDRESLPILLFESEEDARRLSALEEMSDEELEKEEKRLKGELAELKESERDDLAVIEKASRGYEVVKTKVVIYKDGTTEETTERSTKFDWQAAAWRLERRFPERWAKIDRDLEKRIKALEEQLNVKG